MCVRGSQCPNPGAEDEPYRSPRSGSLPKLLVVIALNLLSLNWIDKNEIVNPQRRVWKLETTPLYLD